MLLEPSIFGFFSTNVHDLTNCFLELEALASAPYAICINVYELLLKLFGLIELLL
jgi:hypothetical protein